MAVTITKPKKTLRQKVYDVMEMGGYGSVWGAVFDRFITILIICNVVAVAMETVEPFATENAVYFAYFELGSVIFFTIEYLARIWICVERHHELQESPSKERLKYILSPMAIIDFIAILPFYLVTFGTFDFRFLRIFRLLRLLKIVRYSQGVSSMFQVIYDERRALLAALILMIVATFFAATVIYFVERNVQPDVFGNIPLALWWAITTLTTVGYGDVTPITGFGRLFGAMVMIFGLAFYAIPIGIIASAFTSEIHRRDFVIRFGLVARVPLFKELPASTISEIGRILRARALEPGTIISHKDEPPDGVYFVVTGNVSARIDGSEFPLPPGSFFGDISMLHRPATDATIFARDACRLMMFETKDFKHLLTMQPNLQGKLHGIVDEYLNEARDQGLLDHEQHEQMRQELNDWMTSLKEA